MHTDTSVTRTPTGRDEALVAVFVTKDLTELDIVQGLLESAGIKTALQGQEQLRTLGGQHGMTSFMQLFSKRELGAKILVNPADLAAASSLLADQESAEPFDYDPEQDANP